MKTHAHRRILQLQQAVELFGVWVDLDDPKGGPMFADRVVSLALVQETAHRGEHCSLNVHNCGESLTDPNSNVEPMFVTNEGGDFGYVEPPYGQNYVGLIHARSKDEALSLASVEMAGDIEFAKERTEIGNG